MAKRKRKELPRGDSDDKKQPQLKDLVAAITAENRYAEAFSGPERGKERVKC